MVSGNNIGNDTKSGNVNTWFVSSSFQVRLQVVLRPPSSCLGSNIAMAYVDNEYIKNGTQLQVLKHCQCIILYCTLVLN